MSSDSEVDTFESNQPAPGSNTYPQQCSSLRQGGFVCIKDRPCKIVSMSTSKTGKHGHAKVNLVGIDIFTGKKYEDICPSTHNMNVPNVNRFEFALMDISGGFLSLLENNGELKEDVPLPADKELADKISEMFAAGKEVICTIMSAMNEEHCIAAKEAPK